MAGGGGRTEKGREHGRQPVGLFPDLIESGTGYSGCKRRTAARPQLPGDPADALSGHPSI